MSGDEEREEEKSMENETEGEKMTRILLQKMTGMEKRMKQLETDMQILKDGGTLALVMSQIKH